MTEKSKLETTGFMEKPMAQSHRKIKGDICITQYTSTSLNIAQRVEEKSLNV